MNCPAYSYSSLCRLVVPSFIVLAPLPFLSYPLSVLVDYHSFEPSLLRASLLESESESEDLTYIIHDNVPNLNNGSMILIGCIISINN